MTPRLTWEYSVQEYLQEADLNKIGAEGWELVGVATHGTIPTFYFKRPVADLRERVTLDHRQRFVAAAAGGPGSEG